MRNFFFVLKSLCGGKSANTPPSEFSYASRVSAILKPLALTLLFVFAGVGNAWGVTQAVSGSSYRITATVGNTTYYMVAPPSSGMGTVTTTESDGTVFTFTQENNNWYVTFQSGNTTYYMSESSTNANVTVSTDKTAMSIVGVNGNYAKIGNSSRWIYFNSSASPKRMGCYASNSNQTGVVLAEVAIPRTVSWKCNGNAWTSGVVDGNTTVNSGSKISAVPTAPTTNNCDNSKVFVGWTATKDYSNETTAPEDLFTDVAGSPTISTNVTFYAVFANETTETINVPAGNKQYTATITYSQLTANASYANSDGDYSSTGTASDESTTTVGWTTSYIQNSSSKLHFKSNTGFVYNKNSWGTINSISFSDNQSDNFNVYIGSSAQPSSAGSGGFFKVKAKTVSGGPYVATITITFTQSTPASSYEQTTYSNYVTSCCTPLAQINGSVIESQTTATSATVSWHIPVDGNSNKEAAGVILHLYADNNNAKGEEIIGKKTDYSSDNTTTTHLFEGLDPATKYWFTIELIGQEAGGVTYCDSGEGEAVSFTTGAATTTWTITYNANADGVTNMPSATYAEKSTGEGTLSSTEPVRPGYTFLGWDEIDDATSATYKAGDPITGVEDDLNLSAIWERRDVTLVAGSGSVASSSLIPNAQGKVTLPAATPSAACATLGWEFVGWADAEATGDKPTTIIAAGEYTPDAKKTLYAVYGVLGENFEKISTAAEFTTGNYVFATAAGKALNNSISDKQTAGTDVTITSGTSISNPVQAAIWLVTKSNSNYTLYNAATEGTNKYLNIIADNNYGQLASESTGVAYTVSFDAGAIILTSVSCSPQQIEYHNGVFKSWNGQSVAIYAFKQDYDSYETSPNCTAYTLSSAITPAASGEVELGKSSLITDATTTATASPTEGYRFLHWTISGTGASMSNTEEGKSTDNPVTITMGSEDATITAHFEAIPTYNIEFSINGAKVEALKLADQLEGTAIVFPDAAAITAANAFPTTDKKFVGWIEASTVEDPAIAPTFVTSATAAENKTYYAVFADQVSEGGYNKLTSAEGLAAGDKIVVTNGSSVGMKAFGQPSDNNFKGAEIEIEGNQITNLGEACELTLGGTAGHWTLFDGAKYVYAAGSAKSGSGYNNYMKGKDTKDAACEWTISIDGETTTIRSVENTATSYMRYNSNNTSVFSCYNTASQNAVVLFKKAANIYEDYVTNIATLSGIEITTAPEKTVYKKGETLDLTGMVVKATYSDSRVRTLSSDKYTVEPNAGTALAASNNKFTVSYTEGETTKTAEQTIVVYELTSIAVTNAPATTIYLEGATFDKTGMVVKATWGTGEDKIVETLDAEDYTVDPSVLDATSITSVTLSYTHEGVTKTTPQEVTVNERPSLTMSWKVGNADATTSKIYINGDDQYLLVLPDVDPNPVDAGFTSDFVFKGWTSDETIAKSGENIHFAEAGDEMSVATTFRAVFAQGEESEVEVFNETFASCDGTGGNDGSWSGSIASKTTPEALTSTWTLQNSNAASACLKLGSGNNPASAQTPSINCGDATSAKLTFKAGAWDNNDDGTTLSLTYTNCTGDKLSETMVKGEWTSYEVALTNISGAITIKFASTTGSKHRFFLDDVVVKKTVTNYSNYRFAPSVVTAPVIDLEAGTYYGAQEVTITAEKAIYYTLDGTNPDKNSIAYNSVINLNEAGTKTLKAVAYDSENDDYSAIVSAEYTIVTEIDAPTMPATGKFYEDSKEVTIEHALTVEGAKIYYSYDNAAYSEYSEALTITETKTVWAYATIGSLESEKVSATYTKGQTVTYTKLTSADQLAAGMEFVIYSTPSTGNHFGAGALSGSYLEKVEVTAPEEDVLTIRDEAVTVFTLGGEPDAWTMTSGADTLKSTGDKNVNYSTGTDTWNIARSDSKTMISSTLSGSGPLQYNASSPRFTTYNSASQTAIEIFYLPYDAAYTLTYKDANGNEIKSVKVVAGYEYTIVNSNCGTEPANSEFYAWTDGANYYRVGDPITVNTEITLTAVWKETLRGELYEGKWGTFCPQHEIRAFEGASFYTLTYLQMEAGMPYKLFFDEVETDYLEAGKPYLFIAEGEAIKGIKVGDKVTTAANYNGFYGNVSGSTNTISTIQTEYQASGDIVNYYGLKNNTFTLLGNGTTVANERAVVQIKNGQLDCPNPPLHLAPARPGVRRVVASNNAPQIATGVDELNASETPVKMMIDGQLFILRGEKMYDATGRLVK